MAAETPKIELIYDADCPNVGRARERLSQAVAERGQGLGWTEWRSDDPALPDYARGHLSEGVGGLGTRARYQMPVGVTGIVSLRVDKLHSESLQLFTVRQGCGRGRACGGLADGTSEESSTNPKPSAPSAAA
jgi:hypothetical protein